LGAVLGGAVMPAILQSAGLAPVLYFSVAISVAGLILSHLFLDETMGRVLPQSDRYELEMAAVGGPGNGNAAATNAADANSMAGAETNGAAGPIAVGIAKDEATAALVSDAVDSTADIR
jgi:hypothetical protein